VFAKTCKRRVVHNMVDGIIGSYMGVTFISVSIFIHGFACIAV
jgi:hypothetical protein